MPFSWAIKLKRAEEIKIRRAKTLAKQGDVEIKLRHPQWVINAQQNNYVELTKSVKEDIQRAQKTSLDRRVKLAGN